MTLRGLDINANPIGYTNFVNKLHTDPQKWGFLIEDDNIILDYPEYQGDIHHQNWHLTQHDYNALFNGTGIKVVGKDMRDRGQQSRPERMKRIWRDWEYRAHRRQERNHYEAENFLNRATARVAHYAPQADIKVEIENPYNYTPYLLRRHSKRKKN